MIFPIPGHNLGWKQVNHVIGDALVLLAITVPVTNLRHFTHKASVMSVHAEAIAHSADWLMRIFVNELVPPVYAVNKVSACSSAEEIWQIL